MEPTKSTPVDDTKNPTLAQQSQLYVYPVRSLLSGLIHPAADELPSNPLRSLNSGLDSLSNSPTPKADYPGGQEVASGERLLSDDRSANRMRSSPNFSSDAPPAVNESDGSRLCLPSSTQQAKKGT
jgi:hypothetical protein